MIIRSGKSLVIRQLRKRNCQGKGSDTQMAKIHPTDRFDSPSCQTLRNGKMEWTRENAPISNGPKSNENGRPIIQPSSTVNGVVGTEGGHLQ